MLGKDKIKQLQKKGIFERKGKLVLQMEEIIPPQRLWDSENGNTEFLLPQGVIYDMLCSYCLPFLFYKQTVLFNRDLIIKHINVVAVKLEIINSSLPQALENMKQSQIELPKQIHNSVQTIEALKERVKICQQRVISLSQFNNSLQKFIEIKEGVIQNEEMKHIIGFPIDFSNDVVGIHPSLM
ncbi:hypothetical protein ENUP19_0051G0022 [Entamoeba nuttalli]|uniref:Uncharacterized protein n=2 Tax=Entamoeba nuttalli TaxID=412467 RepID=K2H7A8_ENTNP|nr:hypothetical protein ENU1_020560 [Entamoeba nuttalli P19]EKE42457.1 hypothetical protein ENU1_020560 [Entamoeba nuttalli P19]|eukprot:XP_008855204.1 hypothetical protein ENU1_020560 [Entamoeba nuttalli P19]